MTFIIGHNELIKAKFISIFSFYESIDCPLSIWYNTLDSNGKNSVPRWYYLEN